MFNFFKKKPVAIIQVSRHTAPEESASITVNAYKLDRNDIYKAIQEAGEAMRLRLMENNKIALDCARIDEGEVSKERVQDVPNKPIRRVK